MANEKEKNHVAASVLHKVLEGERLAIRAYNSSLHKIDDESIQKLLAAFQDDHKLIIERLKSRMRSLNIEPKNKFGVLELIDKAMMEVSSIVGLSSKDKDIIEKIYNNEAKGLQKIKNVEVSALDAQSQKLIKRIKTINTNNLEQLRDLLS
ncbi:ferritin-like domain-containing protein [Halanaerobacter jeridensis]|uniref:DUF2383 domain-containing protein n=1 Tax=Halanaerobacter jeridensis TaxID=706427 RepID=A0A939BRF5_9FIRM|nr:ferritin-like domain-containing protein [Halanaerobacter jeridensis]MBM7555936.1 hypothetical protein [Halanaerobacter jeridensis]